MLSKNNKMKAIYNVVLEKEKRTCRKHVNRDNSTLSNILLEVGSKQHPIRLSPADAR